MREARRRHEDISTLHIIFPKTDLTIKKAKDDDDDDDDDILKIFYILPMSDVPPSRAFTPSFASDSMKFFDAVETLCSDFK